MTPVGHLRAYLTILDGDTQLVPFWLQLRAKWEIDEVYLLQYGPDCREVVQHWCDRFNLKLTIGPVLDQETFGAHKREKLIGEIHNEAKLGWGLYSDADEFPDLPGGYTMRDFLKYGRQGRVNDYPFLGGRWLDRISSTGALTPINWAATLESQYPLSAKIRQWLNANDSCYVASPWPPVSHHPDSCRLARGWGRMVMRKQMVQVHHFKWNATTLRRLRRRLERIHKTHPNSGWEARNIRTVRFLTRSETPIDIHKCKAVGSILGV